MGRGGTEKRRASAAQADELLAAILEQHDGHGRRRKSPAITVSAAGRTVTLPGCPACEAEGKPRAGLYSLSDLPEGFDLRFGRINSDVKVDLAGPAWAYAIAETSPETPLQSMFYPAGDDAARARIIDLLVRHARALDRAHEEAAAGAGAPAEPQDIDPAQALRTRLGADEIWARFDEHVRDLAWIAEPALALSSPGESVDPLTGARVSRVAAYRHGSLGLVLVQVVTEEDPRPLVSWAIFRLGGLEGIAGMQSANELPLNEAAFETFKRDVATAMASAAPAPSAPTGAEDARIIDSARFWGMLRHELRSREWEPASMRANEREDYVLQFVSEHGPVLARCRITMSGTPDAPVFEWRITATMPMTRMSGPLAEGRVTDLNDESLARFRADLDQTTDDTALAEKAGGGGAGKFVPQRPDADTVAKWTWDRLILPEATLRTLRQLQALIEDPSRAERLGIEPPRGALLSGPPGCGKTTIARVLSAQAKASFFCVKASDLLGQFNGQTEKALSDLFEQASKNAPAIVFIDEIEGIAHKRGNPLNPGWKDTQLNQLLVEIDGLAKLKGVFVLGATNRPELLDEGITRGGRLGFKVDIGMPDEATRLRLLQMFSGRMPLAGDVDLADLAKASTKSQHAPADLETLCQLAGLEALARDPDTDKIIAADFTAALSSLVKRADVAEASKGGPIGFRWPPVPNSQPLG